MKRSLWAFTFLHTENTRETTHVFLSKRKKSLRDLSQGQHQEPWENNGLEKHSKGAEGGLNQGTFLAK